MSTGEAGELLGDSNWDFCLNLERASIRREEDCLVDEHLVLVTEVSEFVK